MLEFLSISSLFSFSIEAILTLRLRDKLHRFIEAKESRESLGGGTEGSQLAEARS
jgi:hypothetical protein